MCCVTRAATSWRTMDGTPDRSNTILATGRLPRRLATRRSRRIGSRISGKIDAQSKPPPSGRAIAFRSGQDPRGHPRIIWVPIFAIQTLTTSVSVIPARVPLSAYCGGPRWNCSCFGFPKARFRTSAAAPNRETVATSALRVGRAASNCATE